MALSSLIPDKTRALSSWHLKQLAGGGTMRTIRVRRLPATGHILPTTYIGAVDGSMNACMHHASVPCSVRGLLLTREQ